MRHNKRIEYLAIGDELLLGLRVNTHLAWLGELLGRYGMRVDHAAEVRDTPDAIGEAFCCAWKRADLVITTGGLGPTCDDVTKEIIAATLGLGLQHDAQVESDLRQFFALRGKTPTDNNFRQCGLIDGASALRNPNGTAPGQWLERDGKVLVMLPGPPSEMQPMFLGDVLPRLQQRGWAVEGQGYLQFRTMGIGESQLAQMLEPLLEPLHNQIEPAYCAHTGVVDVRLHPCTDALQNGVAHQLLKQCSQLLGDYFLGPDQPDPAGWILHQLRARHHTLAVAESCTGGLLANRFTNICGASKVFMGGMVCYRNQAKENLLDIPSCLLEQHGAVSAECAAAMATAVAERMESDYGLSITGYAGPEGGTEPAGTVYIGFHSPHGVWSRKEIFSGNRIQIKERSTNAAISFMRLQMLGARR